MNIEPLDILKWIGIVLAAGFIGYFGRYLAMLIIDRVRKQQPPPAPSSPREVTVSQGSKPGDSYVKLEKKRAKAETKRAKKAPQ